MTSVTIQLMHPGVEPHIPSGVANCKVEANLKPHKRKFLCASGDYVESVGDNHLESRPVKSSPLAFWGEWEQPSLAIALPPPHNPSLPKAWHHPELPSNASPIISSAPQSTSKTGCASNEADCVDSQEPNTDPFVFHPGFFYSCCKIKSTNMLSKLNSGDLVVFCSLVSGEMVFDTVFVVAEKLSLKDAHSKSSLFKAAVKRTGFKASKDCEVYQGATIDNKQNGMFSFFPAKPFTHESQIPHFARPKIPAKLISNDYFSGGNLRSFKIIRKNSAAYIWKALVETTLKQNLVLGLSACIKPD
ncbi:MAG: hypothetical protein LW629_12300 [Burkholderiales bacterium]|jgi:hypothetical protein|nr:hypothetical protein [Burkholderiales bacterium]